MVVARVHPDSQQLLLHLQHTNRQDGFLLAAVGSVRLSGCSDPHRLLLPGANSPSLSHLRHLRAPENRLEGGSRWGDGGRTGAQRLLSHGEDDSGSEMWLCALLICIDRGRYRLMFM